MISPTVPTAHISIFALSIAFPFLHLQRAYISSAFRPSNFNHRFIRYLGAEFPKILAHPDVEYRQANLTVPCMSSLCVLIGIDIHDLSEAAVASAFDPPPGKASYSYVFDLTGEVNHDRSEVVRHFYLQNMKSFSSHF